MGRLPLAIFVGSSAVVTASSVEAEAQNILGGTPCGNFRFVYCGWDVLARKSNAHAVVHSVIVVGAVGVGCVEDVIMREGDDSAYYAVTAGRPRQPAECGR
ncbi:uncharacterized protein PITG_22803 [Phytophthora infestans T30-4]|uniref:Secreted protein n=1 Tax=Phytophthora infestans (strain T30-4) TaxID=403677 RepID=D0N548_PHYIT|nr:uncharacterized protein PITG_22803 [Phytophthora infestans T30-4]EEY70006.1 conserved hypothetical protein [Phytophthora infestans T30-4]|eukprot:XP_002998653.1 conserved hypothetical protein [Phytophthora infestans T30-4]